MLCISASQTRVLGTFDSKEIMKSSRRNLTKTQTLSGDIVCMHLCLRRRGEKGCWRRRRSISLRDKKLSRRRLAGRWGACTLDLKPCSRAYRNSSLGSTSRGWGICSASFGFTASARSIGSVFIDPLMSERARLGVYVFRPHDVVRLTRSQARSEMKRMNSFDLFRHIPHCLSWLGGQASEPRKEECKVRVTEHRRMIANVKCQ